MPIGRKEMLEAEMDNHLGYSKSERSDNSNSRNGYKTKQVRSSMGELGIEVPQDRESTFQPQVVQKRPKDISEIESKIIAMYGKGFTTNQISETVQDIYGFEAPTVSSLMLRLTGFCPGSKNGRTGRSVPVILSFISMPSTSLSVISWHGLENGRLCCPGRQFGRNGRDPDD